MKDVKTLAEEIGVTRQTIYRRIKSLDPKHIVIKDKKTYVLPSGEALLKNVSSEPYRIDPAGQYVSDKYIRTLEDQLKIKDKQIEDLTNMAENLSKRLQETAYLLAQKQQLELNPPDKEEKGDIQPDIKANVTDVKVEKRPFRQRLKDFFNK